MSEYIHLLLHFWNGESMCKVAVRFKVNDQLPNPFYMEPETREAIYSHLPNYIQTMGVLTDIEEITEIHDASKGGS